MYRNIIIGLLLSECHGGHPLEMQCSCTGNARAQCTGCISSLVISEQDVTTSEISVTTMKAGLTTPATHSSSLTTTKHPVIRSHSATGQEQRGARQMEHLFSEPVIIVIIFVVMGGIIGVILLLAYGIRKLRMRSPVNVQPAFPQNTDDPLSSVETENPVLPQNNNE